MGACDPQLSLQQNMPFSGPKTSSKAACCSSQSPVPRTFLSRSVTDLRRDCRSPQRTRRWASWTRQAPGSSFPSTTPPVLPSQITSHFHVLFCATASKDIYQNCFHCYCLKNHIFSKKLNLCICISKVTRYRIMLISSWTIFGSVINPWRLCQCFFICDFLSLSHTHIHTY